MTAMWNGQTSCNEIFVPYIKNILNIIPCQNLSYKNWLLKEVMKIYVIPFRS